jgi:hypothetical protein
MKFYLESPMISKYLNHWIDLIFGKYNKKENALKANNLYMSEIYGPKVKKMEKDQKKLDSNSSIP